MPKTVITEQQIINIVKLLVIDCKPLTVASVRLHLGAHGSDSTIHKYLKKWKEDCFKKAVTTVDRNTGRNSQLKVINNYDFLEGKSSLNQELSRKIEQNEHFAQELMNAEKVNIYLKEEIHQLQSSIKKLKIELSETTVIKNNLEQLNQEIQSKIDINTNATIQKMQQTIDDLRLELKILNETYINALRETSTQGHEALMQEKVNSINLQTKIDNLTKELLDSKKKAYEASMAAQIHNRSLSRQNEQLQKILQDNGLEQLLSAEEGSSLAFTNGAAPHGK